jgi:tRNA pseudouridine55 synthase
MSSRRAQQPSVSGFINVNKPPGITSFQVISHLRRVTGIRKLGHSGVLDKPATGVLPIGINRANKLFNFFDTFAKSYLTTFLLGFSTNTDDVTGRALATGNAGRVSDKEAKLALRQFIGDISQRPPAFSTTKVEGKEFYRYALAGEEVPYRLKRVTVDDIEVLGYKDGPTGKELLRELSHLAGGIPGDLKTKLLTLRIKCRGGFYVRSLARDLGGLLQSQGCVFTLVREQVGPFRVENAWTLEALEELAQKDALAEAIEPMSVIAEADETLKLDKASIDKLAQGMHIIVKARYVPEQSRKHGSSLFVAGPDGEIAAVVEVGMPVGTNLPIKPKRLLL